jgi:hypothetical protein
VEDVESQLQAAQAAFDVASSQMNDGIAASFDNDDNSDVAQIVQVLYQHQLALQDVELTSRRMDQEMKEVETVLRRAEQHQHRSC